MERTVLRYAPTYWDKNIEDINTQILLRNSSDEFRTIEYQIKQATRNNNIHINSIKRNQDIHDYGQMLIREQLMAVAESPRRFYRVRRYVLIREQYLTCAVEHNLDHRRCGKASLVITDSPDAVEIEPKSSADYFIDYIVKLSN